MRQRCGHPTPKGPCRRRELHADNLKCPDHGGTGPLARHLKHQLKQERQRAALVREAQAFAATLKSIFQHPKKERTE